MSEKFLHRDEAPFSPAVWQMIDETVVGAAKAQMCGRKLLHTEGPFGLGLKSISTGDNEVTSQEGISAYAGCCTPLVMISSSFKVPARDIAAFESNGAPLSMAQAAQAAIKCARMEDTVVFNGSKELGTQGLLTAKGGGSHKIGNWQEVGKAADDVISGATLLDKQGFVGPYVLALSPTLFENLYRRYPDGDMTELEHIKQIATGGIIKANSLEKGGVMMQTGKQFASIVLGQDLMTGFIGPEGTSYEFSISETAALKLNRPEAVCVLK
ncbi:Maritimacin [Anaerohalosphaera lusitana]|uniref:Maritimacin n=1 Tax=Anaerohalosphaera lusitana TaxID=1936003 RepID=A0A1U9NRD1_9BACT|nr:family 1 encapsulin nanocompartment shell protein [Anaerohalosphaera lusitana]AQT70294.1 Maritimacin [Anaerohalosphaera lusitana]